MNEADITRWDSEADVVVLGSGFAGLAAAIEARNAGATVIVAEKMKATGGNSAISDGGMAAADTPQQRALGISDSPELMYSDMMRAGLGLNHPELVRAVAEHSAEAFQWSVDYLGVPFADRLDQFGGHSVRRCFTAEGISGAPIIRRQTAKARELGAELRLQTRFTAFVTHDAGRVAGVRVREGYSLKDPRAGTERFIRARRAVVLATGGFGADVAFRSAQNPRLTSDIDTTNVSFATGEALIEALRLGAMPIHLSHIQLAPWTSPDERGYGDGPRFADYIAFQYGIIVSPVIGKRIVNELADRKTIADALLEAGRPCIAIADAAAVGRSGWSIEKALSKGVVRTFDSLEELASFYGIEAVSLRSTVEAFNASVRIGTDKEFNKPILEGAPAIERPPFHGMRLWPKVHHTMGGVGIDAHARVLDLERKPVPGLFAAGEVAGGVHGACRLGSCAITECLVYGRIAGRNAAMGIS